MYLIGIYYIGVGNVRAAKSSGNSLRARRTGVRDTGMREHRRGYTAITKYKLSYGVCTRGHMVYVEHDSSPMIAL
jgi:hypothetical protein